MANELKHTDIGTSLTQVEFESVGLHVLNSQATGDLIYASSASQLSRLGIGATNAILTVIGGVPTWQSTLAGLTLTAPTINGTIATTGLTLPAVTLSGALNANSQTISNSNIISLLETTGITCIADTHFIYLRGSPNTAGSGAQVVATGKNYGAAGQFIVYTPDLAGTADVARLTISGKLATAVVTWSNVTQTWSSYGAGTITADASGNLTSVSDIRLKDILGDFTAGVAELLNIQPILHKWNKQSGLDQDNIYAGFSAQNVMKYIPQAVGKQNDGYYTLNDRPILAACVNAIKELQAEIDKLKIKALLPKSNYAAVEKINEEGIIKSKPLPEPLPLKDVVM